MYLKRLILSNFKNIVSADLYFSQKINCIYGDNGEGKTNLLDAIYYLSVTKSFLLPTDQFVYRHGASDASLYGLYDLSGVEERISIGLKTSSDKILKRNGKNYTKISDHIGLIPIVIISPSDTSLIHYSAEERRRFMNIILSQTDREYLHSMQAYNKVLLQRNRLLKNSDVSSIVMDAFSSQMKQYSDYIYKRRKDFIEFISPIVQEFYAVISGGKESVSLEYVSDLDRGSVTELLEKAKERDLMLKYTTVGIHRDDILFNLDGAPMKKCSSQGQQKSFLISLKMAQLSQMRHIYGFPPILLLDDVFDKLDMKRVEFLLGMVAKEDFGQIFITDSNKVRISQIVSALSSECSFFNVTNGVFEKISEDGKGGC